MHSRNSTFRAASSDPSVRAWRMAARASLSAFGDFCANVATVFCAHSLGLRGQGLQHCLDGVARPKMPIDIGVR